jgi:hypothetical protein
VRFQLGAAVPETAAPFFNPGDFMLDFLIAGLMLAVVAYAAVEVAGYGDDCPCHELEAGRRRVAPFA